MNRPTWVTVVGILGIILGSFGIFGAAQLMLTPKMMEMQKDMMAEIQESMEDQETSESDRGAPDMTEMFEKMWVVPEWFGTWCITAGTIGLLISGFYVFASIRLLQTTPTAVRLFYSAAGINIGFALLKAVVAMLATSYMIKAMMVGGLFGTVINVVLLIVVATGNKEVFTSVRYAGAAGQRRSC